MFAGDSIIYPIGGLAFVVVSAALIKLFFQKDNELPNHRIKKINRDGKLRANYASGRTAFLLIALIAVSLWGGVADMEYRYRPLL